MLAWLHNEQAEESISDSTLDTWAEFDQGKEGDADLGEMIRRKVNDRLFKQESAVRAISPPPKRASNKTLVWKVAAAVLIGTVSVLGYFYVNTPAESPSVEIEIAQIKKENPKGQKSRVYLPDGTVVWLNSESELQYPEKFNDTVRLVKLQGEAFFDVAENKDIPFVVEAGQTSTRVLGTIFNINAFPENNGVTISLIEGTVSFKYDRDRAEESRIIIQGEGVFAPDNGQAPKVFQFDPGKYIKWNEGVLKFEKADLKTVVFVLERWYGVNIHVKNYNNQAWSFSGTFDNENLSNVLMNLSRMRDFTYEINGKDVSIKF